MLPAAPRAESAGGERSTEEVLADRLIHTLEPVVGGDHVRATVHAEFDPSTVEEQQESYDPEKTVALTMQRSEESNGGAQPGGASGTASNVPGGGSRPRPLQRQPCALEVAKTEPMRSTKSCVTPSEPAGRLKRLAVAVLVDDIYNPANKSNPRQRRSPEELKSIEEIAKASVGFDSTRGDILTVQNISFQVASDRSSGASHAAGKDAHPADGLEQLRPHRGLAAAVPGHLPAGPAPGKKQLIRSLNAAQPKDSARPCLQGRRGLTRRCRRATSRLDEASADGAAQGRHRLPGQARAGQRLAPGSELDQRWGALDDGHSAALAGGHPQGRHSAGPAGRGGRQPDLQEPE